LNSSLTAIGNWSQQIEIPLHNAMQVSIEMLGKTGRGACERAIIYMATSAGSARNKLTKAAKKNRKTQSDKQGKYVERYYSNGETRRDYRWMFEGDAAELLNTRKGIKTWDQAREIKSRGLARRSWMWGLSGLVPMKSKPMPGVSHLREYTGDKESGLILTNRLGYIDKVTVPGLERRVAQMASNKIMAQAAKKAERKFGIVVDRLESGRKRKAKARLDREFKKARGAGKK